MGYILVAYRDTHKISDFNFRKRKIKYIQKKINILDGKRLHLNLANVENRKLENN